MHTYGSHFTGLCAATAASSAGFYDDPRNLPTLFQRHFRLSETKFNAIIFCINIHLRKPGHFSLRTGRVSIPQQIYFITVVCKKREHRFADFSIAAETCRVIAMETTWFDATVLAWVLMPDHYHVLQLGERSSLQKVMQRANSILAIAANKAASRKGQVWQSAFHDHALRDDKQVIPAARYLVATPLRAKLVSRVGDYPFWDVIWLTGDA